MSDVVRVDEASIENHDLADQRTRRAPAVGVALSVLWWVEEEASPPSNDDAP